jgi:CubicO group peptidase (beta-lactamase class C family)
MQRFACLGLAAWLVSCASLEPAPDCVRAQRFMSGLAAQGLFQGAFVIGTRDGTRCEGAYGMANVEAGAPFTPDTANDGGSIGKTLTAAALLALAEDGKLDLEAPVRQYLPAYPHAATRVRHLILHSAALPGHNWFDAEFGEGKPRSNTNQLAAVAARGVPPAFVPGTRFVYDNAAYDMAALVIESAAGVPYASFIRTRFLDPLGMRSAFVRPGRLADFPGIRTRGYRRLEGAMSAHDAIEGEEFHGSGNVYQSARDLQAWVHAFAVDSPVVRPARRAAAARARLDDGRATGLSLSSWYSDAGGTRHYYTGDHQGFFNFGYWDASSGRTVAFVGNLALSPWMRGALPRTLLAIAEGRDAEIQPAPQTSPTATAQPMEGTWLVEGVGPIEIFREGRRRLVRDPSGVEYPMYGAGGGWYATPGLDAWLHHDGAGKLVWNSVFRLAEGRRGGG